MSEAKKSESESQSQSPIHAEPVNPEPVAIIGIGCMFPQAQDTDSFWANVRDGVDCITDVPPSHWSLEDYFDEDPNAPDMTYGARGGFLEPVDFDPMAFGISPRDIEATDTSQLLGLLVAQRALDDAGYGQDGKDFDRGRTSVVLGVTGTLPAVIPLGARLGHPIWRRALAEAGVDPETAQDVVERIGDAYPEWQENSFPGLLGNVVAGRIAKRLNLHGTNCVVDAACASSLSAVHMAILELQAGRTDMSLCGGIDTFNDIFMYMCFSKTPALSPSGNAKPFAKDADGTVLGEGLGMFVLKRLSDAERDGDRVYAVIKGLGTSSDDDEAAIYAPSSDGQARALRGAYKLAQVEPQTIEMVEAHGTGTKVGDATEVRGLRTVYGESDAPWCALGSVKSNIGHTKAAAGAAGLIKGALSVYHGVIPPSIKVGEASDAVTEGNTPFYVSRAKRPWVAKGGHPRRAAVSAFGFGGSNYHCVVESHGDNSAKTIDWDGEAQIVAFSGDTPEALTHRLEGYTPGGTRPERRRNAAKSRETFSHQAPYRLLIPCAVGDIPERLESAKASLARQGAGSWQTPHGIVCGAGDAPGKVAALFPGQGAQYVGMLRDLLCLSPRGQQTLGHAARGAPELSECLYPPNPRPEHEAQLRQTKVAQPALGATSLAALAFLRELGFKADSVAGHSYGELVALYAAGRLDAGELLTLSRLRGELMERAAGDDPGTMLAVFAGQDAITPHLEGLDVTPANHNSPRQTVLSGSSVVIAEVASRLSTAGIETRPLTVAAAFHSDRVASAAEPLLSALQGVALDAVNGAPTVYANSTAQRYPNAPEEARELLGRQLAKPVLFAPMIEQMIHDGARTFVEIGPGRRLSGLVGDIAASHDDVVAIALDASGGEGNGMLDIARAVTTLAARGHALQLRNWDPVDTRGDEVKKPRLTVPISGANYRVPKEPRPPRKPPSAPSNAVPSRQHTRTPQADAMTRRNGSSPAPQPPRATDISPPQHPAASTGDATLLAQALSQSQAQLNALAEMQARAAALHEKFLESQAAAVQSYQALALQQQRIMGTGAAPHATVTAPALPALPPVPQMPVPAPTQPAAVAAPTSALAPAPTPEPMPSPSPAPTGGGQVVAETLLKVIADKTGYPVEMLDLGMGLQSDLGIDSIKRVEILSALQQELPDAPAIKPEHLGELRTLGDIATFLGASDGAASAGSPQIQQTPETTSAQPPPASQNQGSEVGAVLLEVVAAKTGYPADMLDLSMSLQGDLGIDSIKRVEMLSALQERLPNAPVIKPEHLGQLQTLQQIADFIGDSSGGATPSPAVVPERAARQVSVGAASVGQPLRLKVALQPITLSEPTLPKGRFWIVVGDKSQTKTPLVSALRGVLRNAGRDADVFAVDGVPMIPEDLAACILLAPSRPDDGYLKAAFPLLQVIGDALRKTPGATLVGVTTLDGAMGWSDAGPSVSESNLPVGQAGILGLVKSVGHEWPEVTARTVDVAPGLAVDGDASALLSAAFGAPDGVVEVGLGTKGAVTPVLEEAPIEGNGGVRFGAQDVVLLTGGARGVTAEVAVALAKEGGPRLALLGRTSVPDAEPDWLTQCSTEAEIKRGLAQNEGLGVRDLDAAYKRVAASREIQQNLERIRDAGSEVEYWSVDVRDSESVDACLQAITERFGPVTGFIHGAGVLADKLLEDKTPDDVARVYDTKVVGARSILEHLDLSRLKGVVFFSSSTGRFGRKGQSDYAAANEVLNKTAQALGRAHPHTRVVAVNWGPWAGGMVTPALEKLFRSEGIEPINLAAGASYLMRELACGGGPAEVIILGTGSTLPDSPVPSPADSTETGEDPLAVAFERQLSVATHPFLSSHVLDGKAVLPVAMMMEWFAHAALHGNPGLRFYGLRDLRVLKGVILDHDATLPVRVCSGDIEPQGKEYLVPVELCSGGSNGHRVVHARAVVVLSRELGQSIPPRPVSASGGYQRGVETIYDDYLFHGPHLQGLQQVDGCDRAGVQAKVAPGPVPKTWMEMPPRGRWITDPLAVDCAFQLMCLWGFECADHTSLPTFIGDFRQYAAAFPGEPLEVRIDIVEATAHRVIADIDWVDAQGKLVARLTGYECVSDSSLNQAFRRNRLTAGANAPA